MKFLAVLAVIVLCAAAVQARTSRPQLVRLHQVSRQEYNELLRLTQGKEEVSEARLLSSSIAGIKGLASGFAAGNFIPAIFSSGSKDQPKKGRPLCVISTNDIEQDQERRLGRVVSIEYEPNSDSSSGSSSGSGSGHGSGGHGSGGHGSGGHGSGGHGSGGHGSGGHGSGGHGSGGDDSSENDDVTTVNCILIVNGTDTTTTTTTPKPDHEHGHGHGGHGHGHGHGYGPKPGGYYPQPAPYYPPYYGYPPFYPPPPYPYPPPPHHPPGKPHHSDGGGKRSVDEDEQEEEEQEVGRLIDAYNGFYYQPEGVTLRNGKYSKVSQETSAYQPASYPQQEYANTYPKVVRNYGLTHPAPVYVRSPQYEQEH